MTPKEKAKELVEKFYLCMPHKDVKLTACEESKQLIIKMERLAAKQCAIICCEEILSASTIKLADSGSGKFVYIDDYWQEVKSEIENCK